MRTTFFILSCLLTFFTFTTAFAPGWGNEEYGKAGYYADSLHGRKTSSGEKYDKNAMTCAHKTLPFGTRVRVTRLDNKKSVIVRVNDRGPFSKGYVIDLSRRAATVIDMIDDGIARVKVEALEEDEAAEVPAQYNNGDKDKGKKGARTALVKAKTTPKGGGSGKIAAAKPFKPAQYNTSEGDPEPANAVATGDLYKVDISPASRKGFGVQVSTLYDADNVLPIVTELQKKYAGKVLVSVENDTANNQSTYRVVVGSYPTKAAAEAAQKSLSKTYKRCFVIPLSE
jgi:rare lipoprotein A